MALFLSTYINRIDRKGRVSVPAPFRAALAGASFPGIVVFPSFRASYDAIEACAMDRMERLSAGVDHLNPFSDEHDDFASVLFGAAVELSFDGEGRVMLPDEMIVHARIEEAAAFVGRGQTFQIWEPGALEDFQAEARRRARESRDRLTLEPSGSDSTRSDPSGGGER